MLQVGQVVEVEVRTVAVFGLFCQYDGQEVLVRIPELSWVASFNSCHQFAAPGDRLTVQVLQVDGASGQAAASLLARHPNPWPTDRLAVGAEHQARVVRFVEAADRCGGPGYLLELLPGAYVMLCNPGADLVPGRTCEVTVVESDFSRRAVRVALKPGVRAELVIGRSSPG